MAPQGLLALAVDLKLPKFEADGNRYQYSWPPPQPNLALQIAAIRPDPFLVHEAAAGTYIKDVTAASLRTTGGRSPRPSSGSASSRQRAAEAEAAKERDRKAYRERGWPSG